MLKGDVPRAFDLSSAHPHSNERLAVLIGDLCEALGELIRSRGPLRGIDRNHAVDAGIIQTGRDGVLVPGCVRISQNVHRVGLAPIYGEMGVQRPDAVLRKGCKPSAQPDQRIGRDDAGASCIGDNRDLGPFREMLRMQDLCHIKQIRNISHPDNTDPLEGRIACSIFAPHRPGMR